MAKPKLIVIVARPGAGKTTLVKAWRKKYRKYKIFDVYPHVIPFALISRGVTDPKKMRVGYQRFHSEIKKTIKDNRIVETGISFPELNMRGFGDLHAKADVYIFFLLRNTKQCFAYKKKQHGDSYASAQLRERMRRTFPSVHKALAKKYRLKIRTIYTHRGYPKAIQTIENTIA